MLTEIISVYPYASSNDYNMDYMGFSDTRKKYWLKCHGALYKIELKTGLIRGADR